MDPTEVTFAREGNNKGLQYGLFCMGHLGGVTLRVSVSGCLRTDGQQCKAGGYFGERSHYMEIEETWIHFTFLGTLPWANVTGERYVKFDVILMGEGIIIY